MQVKGRSSRHADKHILSAVMLPTEVCPEGPPKGTEICAPYGSPDVLTGQNSCHCRDARGGLFLAHWQVTATDQMFSPPGQTLLRGHLCAEHGVGRGCLWPDPGSCTHVPCAYTFGHRFCGR